MYEWLCYFFKYTFECKNSKSFFKENGKFYNIKNKPINKELFYVSNSDTSICSSLPDQNVICVNLDLCKDRSLLYIYLAHEVRHLYQFACVFNKNQKVFSIDENQVCIWKKEMENYRDSRCENYVEQEMEKDANLFSNFIAAVIFKRTIDIKGVSQEEYLFKTKMFINFFTSIPIKKKLVEKQIIRMSRMKA